MSSNIICSYIDANIENISDVPFGDQTETINLHHNKISRLLKGVFPTTLVNLDLSSNRLTTLSGVENLLNLKKLNLSANGIVDIKAIRYLR